MPASEQASLHLAPPRSGASSSADASRAAARGAIGEPGKISSSILAGASNGAHAALNARSSSCSDPLWMDGRLRPARGCPDRASP